MSNVSMFTIGNLGGLSEPRGASPERNAPNGGGAPVSALGGFEMAWALTPAVVNRQLASLQQAVCCPPQSRWATSTRRAC